MALAGPKGTSKQTCVEELFISACLFRGVCLCVCVSVCVCVCMGGLDYVIKP